jgi:hypothetical protein
VREGCCAVPFSDGARGSQYLREDVMEGELLEGGRKGGGGDTLSRSRLLLLLLRKLFLSRSLLAAQSSAQ